MHFIFLHQLNFALQGNVFTVPSIPACITFRITSPVFLKRFKCLKKIPMYLIHIFCHELFGQKNILVLFFRNLATNKLFLSSNNAMYEMKG